MPETLVILIGNSDDKLTQQEWASFISDVQAGIDNWAKAVHFTGYSRPDVIWQNACWVVEWDTADLENLNAELKDLALHYRQESIAVIVGGRTTFVRSGK